MQCIDIQLSQDEDNIIEFKIYQFNGAQIAINQFLENSNLNFSQEHYDRLINTYIENYQLLVDYILLLLEKRNYQNIQIQEINYKYYKGCLKVYL